MNKYRFYVITKKTIKYTNTLKEAIRLFEKVDYIEGYKALGVEKNDISACDLLIENEGRLWISNDCEVMEEFKNDSLICLNAREVIKKEIF